MEREGEVGEERGDKRSMATRIITVLVNKVDTPEDNKIMARREDREDTAEVESRNTEYGP